MVSQMARAKNLGEPFMAHLENLYDIPCVHNIITLVETYADTVIII